MSMTEKRATKEGTRLALRGFFDRALRRRPTEPKASVATADLDWEDGDHNPRSVKEVAVFDPWEPGSQLTQPASPTDINPDTVLSRDDVCRTESIPVSESQAVPPGEAEQRRQHLEDDRDTSGQSTEQVAAAPPSNPETDNGDEWEDLEEAEEDFAELQNELLANDSALFSDENTERIDTPDDEDVNLAKPSVQTSVIEDNTIESDWEEDTEGAGSFDAFDSVEDPLSLSEVDFGLFDFDAEAQQSPWDLATGTDETLLRRAREKAAAITSMLDLRNMKEQDLALAFLTDLFEHLRHPSTFRALNNAAAKGLDLDTLKAMADLRHVWMQRPEYWVCRYRGDVCHMKHGQAAFTWILARQVCLARSEFFADTMIDDEWLDEWLALARGTPGYWNFPAFIGEKIAGLGAEILHEGLGIRMRRDGLRELGDDYDWYRRVAGPHEEIRLGFHILTPYDERPGDIRPGLREEEGDD